MTSDQEESWAEDPNVYVADEEDDIFSVRTSGELVLEEILRQADGAARTLAGAVRRRLDEAAAAQVGTGFDILVMCLHHTCSVFGPAFTVNNCLVQRA